MIVNCNKFQKAANSGVINCSSFLNEVTSLGDDISRKVILPRYTPILIVGTGIAGSLVASEVERRNLKYVALTDAINPLLNNSAISFANCRIPNKNNLSQIIKSSVNLGQDEYIVRFVYDNANLVEHLFSELKIQYVKTSFGIMPSLECPWR